MYAILSKGVAMKSVMELLYELRVDHDLTQAEVAGDLPTTLLQIWNGWIWASTPPFCFTGKLLSGFRRLSDRTPSQSGAERGRHGLPDRSIQLRKSAPWCDGPQCERPAGCFGICTFVAIKGTEQKCGLNWLPAWKKRRIGAWIVRPDGRAFLVHT